MAWKGATGICWVESKDTAKQLTVHRATSQQNYPDPNVSRAEVENP